MRKVVINKCFGGFGLSKEALNLLGQESDSFYWMDDKRTDSLLVEVVEELGERASGEYAKLKVVELPEDVQWSIRERDGNEWIAENHRLGGSKTMQIHREDLENLLEEVRTKIADQGRMVDDRLLSKEKMLEGCLIDLDKSNNQQEQ